MVLANAQQIPKKARRSRAGESAAVSTRTVQTTPGDRSAAKAVNIGGSLLTARPRPAQDAFYVATLGGGFRPRRFKVAIIHGRGKTSLDIACRASNLACHSVHPRGPRGACAAQVCELSVAQLWYE